MFFFLISNIESKIFKPMIMFLSFSLFECINKNNIFENINYVVYYYSLLDIIPFEIYLVSVI